MSKFRISYSVLNTWAMGYQDDAVERFFGRWPEPTQPMKDGFDLHKKWEEEITQTKSMPQIFGGAKLKAPQLELWGEREFEDIKLVGKLDLLDTPRGIDWKTGVKPASGYANSAQHKVYKILWPEIEVFEYHACNFALTDDHPDRITMALVHTDKNMLIEGIEWVLKHSNALKEYIEAKGLDWSSRDR